MLYRLLFLAILTTAYAGIVVAHKAGSFIKFEVCRLDFSSMPPEARPTGRIIHFYHPENTPIAVETMQTSGIECAKVWGSETGVFVVGSANEVMRKFMLNNLE